MPRPHVRFAALLALCTPLALAGEPKPPRLTPEERELVLATNRLDEEAGQLFEQGKPAEAVVKIEQALALWRKLYPTSKYPDGHAALAANLDNVGFMLFHAGSVQKAQACLELGLAMYRALYPESKYPDGHPSLAVSLGNIGQMLQAAGSVEKGLPYVEQALTMNRKYFSQAKYTGGHPELARSLNNVGGMLLAAGATERARPCLEEALAMYRRLYPESKYPAGHPELAQVLNNMGGLLQAAGSPGKALPYYEQALEVQRKLYPESKYPGGHPGGHPGVANSLNQLGFMLQSAGSADKALPYCEQALVMYRRLYPESKYPAGHPDLATSLEYLGTTLQAAGSPEKALAYEVEARTNWRAGMGDVRRVAAKNPLGYVGLVLSGGEVMSGLSILDLNLENLKLVTLSACETGLGEYTGGKGVESLQMAFHLAGAENVVASLWKVNDAATAALMAKFYYELWVN